MSDVSRYPQPDEARASVWDGSITNAVYCGVVNLFGGLTQESYANVLQCIRDMESKNGAPGPTLGDVKIMDTATEMQLTAGKVLEALRAGESASAVETLISPYAKDKATLDKFSDILITADAKSQERDYKMTAHNGNLWIFYAGGDRTFLHVGAGSTK